MSCTRLVLELQYDGTSWQGWQGQPNGRGIQNALAAAFTSITGSAVATEAAGRTDAGVHALAQTVHADVALRMGMQEWCIALNAQLPPSIRVQRVWEAEPGFHARFSSVGKHYCYKLWRGSILPPWKVGQAWHVPSELDEALLQSALALMEGEHDFRRLSSRRTDVSERRDGPELTTRRLHSVSMTQEGSEWLLHFHGGGFLYRMVRVLVGTAVQVARGKLPLAALEDMLAHPSGPRSTSCAPPDGLYLVKVVYEKAAPV